MKHPFQNLTRKNAFETFRFRQGGQVPAAETIEDRISDHYAGLSAKLRTAADYVAAHPVDIATRSLRSVAQTSGVSPATFSRLARVLGYADYEALREAGRAAVGRRLIPFAERARSLQAQDRRTTAADLLHDQAQAAVANIAYLEQNISPARLEAAVDALHRAGAVLLVGSMGSAGLVDYFGYQAQWVARNWRVADRGGTSTAAMLLQMGPGDAAFVLTKTPYAARSIQALQAARDRGLTTIAVTDSHASPALPLADHAFVVPTESPNFFSSYAASLVLVETLMTLLLARSGPAAETRILAMEELSRRLGDHWPP